MFEVTGKVWSEVDKKSRLNICLPITSGLPIEIYMRMTSFVHYGVLLLFWVVFHCTEQNTGILLKNYQN